VAASRAMMRSNTRPRVSTACRNPATVSYISFWNPRHGRERGREQAGRAGSPPRSWREPARCAVPLDRRPRRPGRAGFLRSRGRGSAPPRRRWRPGPGRAMRRRRRSGRRGVVTQKPECSCFSVGARWRGGGHPPPWRETRWHAEVNAEVHVPGVRERQARSWETPSGRSGVQRTRSPWRLRPFRWWKRLRLTRSQFVDGVAVLGGRIAGFERLACREAPYLRAGHLDSRF
jgi:hypothetical protein